MIFKKCLCLVFSASVMYYVSNTVICLYLIFWYWSGRGWLFIKQEQHPLTWISSACSSAPAKCLASLKTTSSTSLKQVRHIRMLVCMHTCVCVLHVWSVCCRERRTLPFSHDSDVSWEGIHIWCSLWWSYPHSPRAAEVLIQCFCLSCVICLNICIQTFFTF